MIIYSFNVNGIRSAINKGLIDYIKSSNPDIMCFQEIKLSETNLVEPLFTELGYNCFWHPAKKRGYSGVGIISKIKPIKVVEGFGNEFFDNEGRVLTAYFKDVTVSTVYFPSGSSGDIRQEKKMEFLAEFQKYIIEKKDPHLVICGDINICKEPIDIHNPVSNKNSSGFLPEEREWFAGFIEVGFVDTFRIKNSEAHNYTWWSYRAGARDKNLGWRIDYFLISKDIEYRLMAANIHSEVKMSDHCPISIVLN